jgi:hypothetical protein
VVPIPGRAPVEPGDPVSSFWSTRGAPAGGSITLSHDRQWLDAEGGDCQAAVRVCQRSAAAFLTTTALARSDRRGRPAADLRSLRAQAYVILAWGHLWTAGVKDIEPLETNAWFAAQRLVECYRRALRPGWPWFESRLTYANAALPHALFVAAARWPKDPFLEVAGVVRLPRKATTPRPSSAGEQWLVSLWRGQGPPISNRSRP